MYCHKEIDTAKKNSKIKKTNVPFSGGGTLKKTQYHHFFLYLLQSWARYENSQRNYSHKAFWRKKTKAPIMCFAIHFFRSRFFVLNFSDPFIRFLKI